MALRIEGVINGRRVNRTVSDPAELLALTLGLLDGRVNDARLARVLASLHAAAHGQRTWAWSADEFQLTMHPGDAG